MRRVTVTAALVAAVLTGLFSAWAQTPADDAAFRPQIPRAGRASGERVFLDRADKLHKTQTDSFTVVSGDVVFTKGPMTMYCDSAHYYAGTESFEAFGNVRMEQGDTLFVYADELNYDGPAEMAFLYADPGRKVRMINRDVELQTDVFTYDIRADVGYYDQGGVLTDPANRLTSLVGEYVPSTKDANFYVDVHLNSLSSTDTLDIYTDTLLYNTDTHIAELHSPGEIINKRGIIYTSNALYHTQLDTAVLYDRSLVVSPEGRTMTADTIYYDRPAGLGRCYGQMILTDSARKASLTADYGFVNQLTDSCYATGRLLIREYSQGDTLYLHGRQINSRRLLDTVHIAAVPADTLTGAPEIPATFRIDTTHVADIYPRVRFYRSDMQGVCDSMRVTEVDSTMRMFVAPVIWSGERQIYGNIVEVHANDSTMDRVTLPDFGFSSERMVDDYYSQISGKKMVARFEGGELRSIYIDGNVELLMYPEEADSTINKLVKAESAYLFARFAGRTAEYIKMWPETSGAVTPLFLVRKSMMFLPKFKLFKGIRPLSPTDVFVIPAEMDALMDASPRPDPGTPIPTVAPMQVFTPAKAPGSDLSDESDESDPSDMSDQSDN